MASVAPLTFASASGDRIETGRLRFIPGGDTYVATLDFSPLADDEQGVWSLSLATVTGDVIVSGAVVRDRTDCLLGVVHPNRPPGAIVAYNPVVRSDPRRYGFQSEGWRLLYVPDGIDPADFALQAFA